MGCPWSRSRVVSNPVQVVSHLGVHTRDVLLPAAQAPADDADQGHVAVLHTHQGAARVTLQKGDRGQLRAKMQTLWGAVRVNICSAICILHTANMWH